MKNKFRPKGIQSSTYPPNRPSMDVWLKQFNGCTPNNPKWWGKLLEWRNKKAEEIGGFYEMP